MGELYHSANHILELWYLSLGIELVTICSFITRPRHDFKTILKLTQIKVVVLSKDPRVLKQPKWQQHGRFLSFDRFDRNKVNFKIYPNYNESHYTFVIIFEALILVSEKCHLAELKVPNKNNNHRRFSIKKFGEFLFELLMQRKALGQISFDA